jgi:hypothetical protein
MKKFLTGMLLVAATPLWASNLAVPGHTPANPVAILSVPKTKVALKNLTASQFGAHLVAQREAAFQQSEGLRARFAEISTTLGAEVTPSSLLTDQVQGIDFYAVDIDQLPVYVTAIRFNQPGVTGKLIDQLKSDANAASGVSGGHPANTTVEKPFDGGRTISFPAFELYLAEIDGVTLLHSTSFDALQSAVKNEGAALLTSAYFTRSEAGLGEARADMWAFGSMERVAPILGAVLGAGDSLLANALPPQGSARFAFEKDHLALHAFTPVDDMPPAQKRHAIAAPPPGKIAALSYVPGNALAAYSTNHFDGISLLEDLLATIDTLPGMDGTANTVNTRLAASRKELGFDPKTDLLGALGPDATIALLSYTAGEQLLAMPKSTDVVYVGWVKEPERFKNVIATLEEFISPPPKPSADKNAPPPTPVNPITTETFEGVTVSSVAKPSLAWAMADGYFLVGSTPHAVKESIRASKSADSSIAANPDLKRAAALAEETLNGMTVIAPDLLAPLLPADAADAAPWLEKSSLLSVTTAFRPTGKRTDAILMDRSPE